MDASATALLISIVSLIAVVVLVAAIIIYG